MRAIIEHMLLNRREPITHHSNEETRLLRSASDTSVTNNTDSKTGSETSKTDRETGTKLDETLVQRHPYINYKVGQYMSVYMGISLHVRSPEIKTDTTRP